MRTHFDEVLANVTPDFNERQVEAMLYMSYWYAGLYVVIEGWRFLRLADPAVDTALASPNVELLRRYRNSVFHFQRRYFSNRFAEFFAAGEQAIAWVRDLNQQFGRFFLQVLRS